MVLEIFFYAQTSHKHRTTWMIKPGWKRGWVQAKSHRVEPTGGAGEDHSRNSRRLWEVTGIICSLMSSMAAYMSCGECLQTQEAFPYVCSVSTAAAALWVHFLISHICGVGGGRWSNTPVFRRSPTAPLWPETHIGGTCLYGEAPFRIQVPFVHPIPGKQQGRAVSCAPYVLRWC